MTMTTWLTPAHVAGQLHVSKATVYRLVSAGRLAAARVGRLVRVSAESLDDYLRGASAPEASPPSNSRLRPEVHKALWAADRPLKGAALARRCGREYDSYFRGVLAAMVRDGGLKRGGEGYWPAERPLPLAAG